TVLLLVDGRRSLQQVLHMAQQAGVTGAHFDELLALGLVAVPQPEVAAPFAPQPPAEVPELTAVAAVDIPLHTGLTV
ncbi:hypothetical protein ABTH73_19870, partial [Acinetobacter baumannii]